MVRCLWTTFSGCRRVCGGIDFLSFVLFGTGPVELEKGEVIDSSVMRVQQLREFFKQEIESAAEDNLMISLHMKATMMKISDPIIFGHFVSVYYTEALHKHADLLHGLGVNLNNGIGDVYAKIAGHDQQAAVEADLQAVYDSRPGLAMVDSRKGITNLHVPSDVIIDASMPPMIRDGGQVGTDACCCCWRWWWCS